MSTSILASSSQLLESLNSNQTIEVTNSIVPDSIRWVPKQWLFFDVRVSYSELGSNCNIHRTKPNRVTSSQKEHKKMLSYYERSAIRFRWKNLFTLKPKKKIKIKQSIQSMLIGITDSNAEQQTRVGPKTLLATNSNKMRRANEQLLLRSYADLTFLKQVIECPDFSLPLPLHCLPHATANQTEGNPQTNLLDHTWTFQCGMSNLMASHFYFWL